MKNERGVTLLELLAVLAIFSVIMLLLGTVLVNGMKSSNRTATTQQVQQEANYIMERVRLEYLKRPDDPNNPIDPKYESIKLEVVGSKPNQQFTMNDEVISEGYEYILNSTSPIPRRSSYVFNLTIKKTGKDGKSFNVETILSKLP